MHVCKKCLCLILALLTIASVVLSFAGCAEEVESPIDTQGDVTQNQVIESEGETQDTRFEDVNYKGRTFRILTSTNVASIGMGNSNPLIEGDKDLVGDKVNDVVLERNKAVEELLGIQLEFTHLDVDYNGVPAEIRTLNSSGLDEYDLVINDLFPFANLSLEGQFRNTLHDDCQFDFGRNYWYEDYMSDLRLIDDYQYLLAGDYFIDLIRSAHLLLLNKDIYLEYYQTSADELYDVVLNYEWTLDKMNEVISDIYADSNNNGQKDKDDLYGFLSLEYWGGSIAYTVSGNPGFVQRTDDGSLEIILGTNQRAGDLCNAMSAIFNNECTSISQMVESEMLPAFTEGQCLILDYQRLGSLENPLLRAMESDICVLPHPMLYAADKKYTTSTHDTSEVGAILATSTDLEFISTVIEVLNRETAKTVMPKYYDEGLQVTLVDDPKAASMVTIIHDNFGNSFALAYNNALGSKMLNIISDAMEQKREFSAVFISAKKALPRALNKKIEEFEKAISKADS